MALISEGHEYSSPSKRIKLDQTQHLSNSNVELDFGTFSAPLKTVHEVIEGEYIVSAEVMNNGDSGFNEMAPESSTSQAGTSLDVSTHSSRKSDDEGTANSTRDEDRDEVSSTVSYLSDISGLSELSGQDWKPVAGPMSWVQRQMLIGVNPRILLNQLVTDGTQIPPQMDDLTLWKIIMNMMSEPPRRQKLRHINTLVDVVRLLKGAKKIIVLTGAGVSVSCGIPDFRSRDGIYSRLAIDFPDLPDPQAMFDIQYFRQFKPSPCHRFIKMLEKHKKLLRNYSQNIDTLEQVAGIQNVIECHGSFATASCTRCKYKVTADEIREDIFAQRIPLCPHCPQVALPTISDVENKYESYKDLVSQGIMKPDIVFFGEGLPEIFHESMAKDKDECDLLIVIGSSLKVRPVALIPSSIPPDVPQILINREPLPHFSFDVELLGDSDFLSSVHSSMLGEDWMEVCWRPTPLTEASHLTNVSCTSSSHNSGEQLLTIESNEADSLQMSIDSGMDDHNSNMDSKSSEVVDSTTDCIPVGNVSERNPGVSSTGSSCGSVVHRHMSVDSMRDSGIGDGSNSVGNSRDDQPKSEDDLEALRACWQPKIRESLAARLPENSYYLFTPNRYIFPGAEVYYDPDDNEQSAYSSSSSSSESSDSANNSAAEESDNEDGEGEYWEVASGSENPVNIRSP
ncbi:hypothetical protein L9F63_021171 [Diploptera punctata]|uniref:Deacetylase sirtuin-type domain-containing protein n=1 Tax=Diploptera punctata TaxID=6984 RepID=A0AAD7ZQW0_DIPPU|nr:hypothetical protein L9F63_021171 [Diploptera punctata]